MGRVAIVKGTTRIGEIIGKPGRELIGQYLWIGADTTGDDANIVIGITSKESPIDERYHIDLYKLVELGGSYLIFEYAMDTIHLQLKEKLIETVTYSAGSFFWFDVYKGTRMVE